MIFASSSGNMETPTINSNRTPIPRAVNLTPRGRARSASLKTANGLIDFPKSVPKSAIICSTQLNFLAYIPGVEISPTRKRGTTIDDDVINKSTLIRHVSSPSANHKHAVWTQKRSSTLVKKKIINTKKQNHENDVSGNIGLIERSGSLKNRNNKKSVILNRSEGELIEEWKIRAYMLYYKYIAIGAEYEINIDYGTRNRLMLQMNNINQWLKDEEINLNDLNILFDNCIHQMFQFCKFSMGRFKNSDQFEELIRCFDIQHDPEQEEVANLTIIPVSP